MFLAFVGFTACTGDIELRSPDTFYEPKKEYTYNPYGDSILDMAIEDEPVAGNTLVNLNLWQASLDVIGFMGINEISPETGTIVTEWFKSNKSDDETQVLVVVRGVELLSSNISVKIATRDENKKTKPSNDVVQSSLKDAILLKARELKMSRLGK